MKGFVAFLMVMFTVTAVVFLAVGFHTMYRSIYSGGDIVYKTRHITGGDAYYHIITANRAVGWLCGGIIFAVLGSMMSRYHVYYLKQDSNRIT